MERRFSTCGPFVVYFRADGLGEASRDAPTAQKHKDICNSFSTGEQ